VRRVATTSNGESKQVEQKEALANAKEVLQNRTEVELNPFVAEQPLKNGISAQ
jgi:hypothetical protein